MRTSISRILFLFFTVAAFLIPRTFPVHAQSTAIYLPLVVYGQPGAASKSDLFPSLAEFSESVQDGQNGIVRGVYVTDILALHVVQQPEENPLYVSFEKDVVTQYQPATLYGTTGLLAHNFRAGMYFFDLRIGQKVSIIYGDGAVKKYEVEVLKEFQAVDPNNPYSIFVDLETEETLSSSEVFRQIYMKDERVVFQTCIANEGIATWGRLFVIATSDF